jgi:hypothetical protein
MGCTGAPNPSGGVPPTRASRSRPLLVVYCRACSSRRSLKKMHWNSATYIAVSKCESGEGEQK